MNNRQRFTLLFTLLLLLTIAGAALAQSPTDEPTPEVVPDDSSIVVEDGGVVIQQAPQTETPPTEITVEPAESKLDIATLLGVFAAGAIALAAGLAIWTRRGGNVAATISEVSQSSEFAALIREANQLIPASVHQQTLDALKQATDLNRSFGELLQSLRDNLSKPPQGS